MHQPQSAPQVLPLGGSSLTTNVDAWINAINWLNEHAKPTDVAASWWDYGNWLSDLGNVTTMADNTTVNSTKIEDLGFAFMGTENQTLSLLSKYGQDRVKYIVVFEVLRNTAQHAQAHYYALPAGFGDEGKWVWMARISAENTKRYTEDLGLIKANEMWTDENDFGQTDQPNQPLAMERPRIKLHHRRNPLRHASPIRLSRQRPRPIRTQR